MPIPEGILGSIEELHLGVFHLAANKLLALGLEPSLVGVGPGPALGLPVQEILAVCRSVLEPLHLQEREDLFVGDG